MVITDPRQPDDPIVFANDAFLSLSGYERHEILGRNCRFLQGPGTDREEVDRMRRALAAGEGVEVELLNYRKDGSTFWNALVISPVRDEAGAVLHHFASQSDVSDKKAAQAALAGANETLEGEVARRTRDLQRALEQKSILLHEVDHRVKNNLQVVTSLMLLKARRIGDERAQAVLHTMAERIGALAAAHRLLYPADDVRGFDVEEFVRELAGDLVAAHGEGRVRLDLAVDPVRVGAAKATPLALLVHELLSNALRFAFPGGRPGRLSVAATKLGSEFRIVVEDDGVGMDGGAGTEESFGRTLIDMVVRQLRARIAFEDARPGTRAVVMMPLDSEEAHG